MIANVESLAVVHTHTHGYLEDGDFASFFISIDLIRYKIINRAIFVYILLVLLCILRI